MAKVKLDLDNKNANEVLAASAAHIAAMATPEGTALFATPDPTVAAYQVVHNALATGINLITSLEGQLAAARAALPGLVEALKLEMGVRASYVDTTTGGNPAEIPVSGFAVAATPAPIGPLPRPENVKTTMGAYPGTVKTSCKPVYGAKSYLVEVREHIEGTDWVQKSVGTSSRSLISGLTSGKIYAFRIAVVGAAGPSPWSDESVCMAP